MWYNPGARPEQGATPPRAGRGARWSGPGLVPGFVIEQRPLAFQPPAIAAQRAVLAHHAVAGHDHRHGVGGAGPPDGALAVPAAPAPLMTTVSSSIRFPEIRHAFSMAALATIAVPCWSS